MIINKKQFMITFAVLLLICGLLMYAINSVLDKNETCQELLGINETRYQKINGEDNCCFEDYSLTNLNNMRCETWETLLQEKGSP